MGILGIMPVIGALSGAVVGSITTIALHIFTRKIEKKKNENEHLGLFISRLSRLIKKIEFCISVSKNQEVEGYRKDLAIRNLSKSFISLEIAKELIKDLEKSEQYFVQKNYSEKIVIVNDIILELTTLLYQVDDANKQENETVAAIVYDSNIRNYDSIKIKVNKLKNLLEELKNYLK